MKKCCYSRLIKVFKLSSVVFEGWGLNASCYPVQSVVDMNCVTVTTNRPLVEPLPSAQLTYPGNKFLLLIDTMHKICKPFSVCCSSSFHADAILLLDSGIYSLISTYPLFSSQLSLSQLNSQVRHNNDSRSCSSLWTPRSLWWSDNNSQPRHNVCSDAWS